MEAHELNLKGKFYIESVASLPIWTAADERRIVYNLSDHKLYYASNIGWVDFASVTITDPELIALSNVTAAANKLPYFTGAATADTTDLSSFMRTLLDDIDQSTAQSTLGLGSAATLTAGTAANNVVQLDGSARLPAVDGRNLTNLGVTARAYTQTQYPTALALTSSAGALAVDCNTCSLATNTLTANTTVSAATNQTSGKIVELVITGASTYTLSWNANWKATDLVALPTAPAAGKRLWVVAESDGTYMILKSALKEL